VKNPRMQENRASNSAPDGANQTRGTIRAGGLQPGRIICESYQIFYLLLAAHATLEVWHSSHQPRSWSGSISEVKLQSSFMQMAGETASENTADDFVTSISTPILIARKEKGQDRYEAIKKTRSAGKLHGTVTFLVRSPT
jgi:hypothetical protein